MIKIINAYHIIDKDTKNDFYIEENEIISVTTKNKKVITGRILMIDEYHIQLDCSENYESKIIKIRLLENIIKINRFSYITMEDIKKPTKMKKR